MSILISQNLTINTTPGDLANRPLILVENVFQLGTVTASSEVGADNGWLENAVDGMTYDWWEWSALPATLEVDLSTAYPVDMCAIGLHTGVTFVFQYWNGAAWVNLHEAVTTTTTAVHAVIFTEITASRFRINITAADDENILGIVMLGKAIQLPKTFYGGHAPITLNRTTQLVRNRTENGFDAGVYSLRTGASTSVQIDNMKPAWIRNNIESLNKQLEIRPFVFAWRPSTFPNDVAYCWLNSPIKAENSGPRDLMSLSFDLQAFVGGGIVSPIIARLLIGNGQAPWLGLYEDAESALTLDSSPAGLVETTDCSAIAIHSKGIIAASFFQGGIYTYEYRNGVWTAMPALTDLVTWNYGVDIHPDEAKWMVLGVGTSPFVINLYRRYTEGDGSNAYYFERVIPGYIYCKFSPDGELIATSSPGNLFIIGQFNAETGDITNSTNYSFGANSFAWSADSTYFAVCNTGQTPRLKFYKRDFTDDSLSELVADVFWPESPPVTSNSLSNNIAWHPVDPIVIIGTNSSTFVVYKNDGLDEFNDVTSSVVDAQPGVGGAIISVEWSSDGTRLYVGIGGSSLDNLCIYDYANGLLIRRSTQLIGATANTVGDIKGTRFSNGSLEVVPAAVDSVAVKLFNNSDVEVANVRAIGDYTIKPLITITPNIPSTITTVRFYVDDVLVATDITLPFEHVLSFAAEDDLTDKVIRVDAIDFTGVIHTASRTYNVDYNYVWTPADLSPAAWYDPQDADSLTLSGSDLTSIADLSGNGRTLTYAGTRPVYSATGFNSLPGIVFSTNGHSLTTESFANPTGAAGVTVLVAYRSDAKAVSFPIPMTKGDVNQEYNWILQSSGDQTIFRRIIGDNAYTGGAIIENGNNYLWVGQMSNARIRQLVGGVVQAGSAGAATRDLGGPSSLIISATPTNYIQGAIGGIIIMHTDVSDTDLQKLEGWLAHRCGIASSLYVGHPYRDDPPSE